MEGNGLIYWTNQLEFFFKCRLIVSQVVKQKGAFLWNQKVYHRVNKKLPLVPIRSQMSLAYTHTSYLRYILKQSSHLCLGLPHFVRISKLRNACCMCRLPHGLSNNPHVFDSPSGTTCFPKQLQLPYLSRGLPTPALCHIPDLLTSLNSFLC